MYPTLDNYPLHYIEIKPSALLDDECPQGGDHEPVTEEDSRDELINGKVTSVKVWYTTCSKCGQDCLPREPEDEL